MFNIAIRNLHNSFAMLLMAGILASCSSVLSTTPAADRAVDGRFKGTVINWNDGGRQIILYTVVNDDGFAGVCGVWMIEGKVDDRAAVLSMNHNRVEIDGTLLVRGTEWFRKVPYQENLGSVGDARCVRTKVPWNAAFTPRRAALKNDKSTYRIVE